MSVEQKTYSSNYYSLLHDVLSKRNGVNKLWIKYEINPRAVESLFLYLGKGDRERGVEKFEKKYKDRIMIERIGFNKFGRNKFYITIDKSKTKGGWNQFQIGISRRGTLRGILRPVSSDRVDSQDLANARELRSKLGVKYQGPISRVMSDENGVKATELGGENLFELASQTKLKREVRLVIYKSLLQGLRELHRHGYVHSDLKMENIVVVRDGKGEITGVKIIDLDRLAKIGKSHCTRVGTRYMPYSPERIFGKDAGIANPKDDTWAAMCVICNLECSSPENERILQSSLVEKFGEYKKALSGGVAEENLYPKKSLFDGTGPSTLFSNLVFQMGIIEPAERPAVDKIASLLAMIA